MAMTTEQKLESARARLRDAEALYRATSGQRTDMLRTLRTKIARLKREIVKLEGGRS